MSEFLYHHSRTAQQNVQVSKKSGKQTNHTSASQIRNNYQATIYCSIPDEWNKATNPKSTLESPVISDQVS